MKYIILLLAFLIPSISFASAVPTWFKGSGISYYFDEYTSASSTNPFIYLQVPSFSPSVVGSFESSNVYLDKPCITPYYGSNNYAVPCFLFPFDVGSSLTSSDYGLIVSMSTIDPSTVTNFYDWWSTSWFPSPKYTPGIPGVFAPYAELIFNSSTFCNFFASTCPSTVYYGLALRPKSSSLTDYQDFIPVAYWELNLQSGSFGNNPIYTVNTQPGDNIFPAYTGPGSTFAIAQSLKNAVAQNTVQPDCDFTELFQSGFWSECVARSIFNWLFIPSDAAIDQLVEVSTSPDFGRSWPYVVMAPIFTSTLVQACPLENPSTCDIGASPLTVPILDIYGSSTPFTIDVPTRVPAYIDAFFASILQAVIIVGISYALLNRFL